MRACIMAFLAACGRATAREIATALQATNEATVRRQVTYLASTQAIYVDMVGRDPIYYANGKMAHPLLQRNLRAGLTEFAFRTYNDRLSGRALTITEYGITPSGEPRPKSGIRVDLADLGQFIQELREIYERIEKNPELLDTSLRQAAKNGEMK